MTKRILTGILSAVVIGMCAGSGMAQDPSRSMNAVISKFHQVLKNQSLSARVVMTVTNTRAGAMGPMEFQIVMSRGNTRTEMDLARLMAGAGAGKNAGSLPAGLDKMISIFRMDKNIMYQIVPGLNAYCEIAIPDATGDKVGDVKIDRKSEGPEKIGRYACEKVLNTITTADGTTTEVRTWEAKELGGMTIKVETTTAEGTMSMLFLDIKTDTPAASLFEPPSGATKYNSMQELMMGAMMKMMQGQ